MSESGCGNLDSSGVGKGLSESSEDLSHHVGGAVPQLVIRHALPQLLLSTPAHAVNPRSTATVEPLLMDTLNKGHLLVLSLRP